MGSISGSFVLHASAHHSAHAPSLRASHVTDATDATNATARTADGATAVRTEERARERGATARGSSGGGSGGGGASLDISRGKKEGWRRRLCKERRRLLLDERRRRLCKQRCRRLWDKRR